MKGISVNLKDAEKIKKILISEKIYDKGYRPIRKKDKIIFPVLSIIKLKNSEIVEEKFEKSEKEKKDRLKSKLKIPSSYDVIGGIIILEFDEETKKEQKQVADALLKLNSQVHTILKKAGQHSGEFRTQKLSYLAGQKTKETTYRENNCIFQLNVEEVYFSPRLSSERKRIFSQIKNNENILVMFSGCGPYPITISKNTKAKQIIAIEKNKKAHEYMVQNLRLNKIKNIFPILGDVRKEVPKLKQKFDRIIMPLPKDADTFLDLAFLVADKKTKIHLYDFEHESEFDLVQKKIKKEAKKRNIDYKILDIVKCGQYSPGKYRICADFIIK